MNGQKIIPIKGSKCPMCSKYAVLEYEPFCSKRCADLDLGKWLNGIYKIHIKEQAE